MNTQVQSSSYEQPNSKLEHIRMDQVHLDGPKSQIIAFCPDRD